MKAFRLVIVCALLLTLCGCSNEQSTESLLFDTDNGDKIEVFYEGIAYTLHKGTESFYLKDTSDVIVISTALINKFEFEELYWQYSLNEIEEKAETRIEETDKFIQIDSYSKVGLCHRCIWFKDTSIGIYFYSKLSIEEFNIILNDLVINVLSSENSEILNLVTPTLTPTTIIVEPTKIITLEEQLKSGNLSIDNYFRKIYSMRSIKIGDKCYDLGVATFKDFYDGFIETFNMSKSAFVHNEDLVIKPYSMNVWTDDPTFMNEVFTIVYINHTSLPKFASDCIVYSIEFNGNALSRKDNVSDYGSIINFIDVCELEGIKLSEYNEAAVNITNLEDNFIQSLNYSIESNSFYLEYSDIINPSIEYENYLNYKGVDINKVNKDIDKGKVRGLSCGVFCNNSDYVCLDYKLYEHSLEIVNFLINDKTSLLSLYNMSINNIASLHLNEVDTEIFKLVDVYTRSYDGSPIEIVFGREISDICPYFIEDVVLDDYLKKYNLQRFEDYESSGSTFFNGDTFDLKNCILLYNLTANYFNMQSKKYN